MVMSGIKAPDNNKSEFMIIRSGRLEFTGLGRLFYGMMFG